MQNGVKKVTWTDGMFDQYIKGTGWVDAVEKRIGNRELLQQRLTLPHASDPHSFVITAQA